MFSSLSSLDLLPSVTMVYGYRILAHGIEIVNLFLFSMFKTEISIIQCEKKVDFWAENRQGREYWINDIHTFCPHSTSCGSTLCCDTTQPKKSVKLKIGYLLCKQVLYSYLSIINLLDLIM